MVYLDLLNTKPPQDDDKRLQVYYPYLDSDELAIKVRMNGVHRPAAADKIFDKVACGTPCQRIRSIFPCTDYKMNDAIVKGAAVTGNALAEFLECALGDRYRNPNAVTDAHRVLCNMESPGSKIRSVDGEQIDLPLNARCYFESRGKGYAVVYNTYKDDLLVKTETFYIHFKYSKTGSIFSPGNGETISSYLGYYIDQTEEDKYQPEDYTWIENDFDKYLPAFPMGDGRFVHIIFSPYRDREDDTYFVAKPNYYYYATITDSSDPLNFIPGINDWSLSGYQEESVGTIVDGCQVDQDDFGQLTDAEMEEMKHGMNLIEEDIYGSRYDTSGQEILSRFGNISQHLTNTISARNSITTDICFITHFHKLQEGSSNYLTYVMMDSETVLHPKGYECSIIHDISAADKHTDAAGSIVDDNLNGKVVVSGYEDLVTVYNYDRRTSKPTIAPVVIVAVRDDFTYEMHKLWLNALDHDIDADEGDVLQGPVILRFMDADEAEYFMNVIH